MALAEQTIIDRLEVLRDGTVQVREAIEIIDDATGEVKARSFHRRVVSIEDDNPDLSFADAKSQAIINTARTPQRRAAAQARKQAREENPDAPIPSNTPPGLAERTNFRVDVSPRSGEVIVREESEVLRDGVKVAGNRRARRLEDGVDVSALPSEVQNVIKAARGG